METSEADAHNGRATKLAEQVLDDFRGAGFIAVLKILADIIRGGSQTNRDDEQNAVDVIRLALRMLGGGQSREQMIKVLASAIRGFGVG